MPRRSSPRTVRILLAIAAAAAFSGRPFDQFNAAPSTVVAAQGGRGAQGPQGPTPTRAVPAPWICGEKPLKAAFMAAVMASTVRRPVLCAMRPDTMIAATPKAPQIVWITRKRVGVSGVNR